MFLIPPKSKKAAAEWPPLPHERRFTRVRAACDRCRIKKTKCDGSRPCLRCRHDDVICVDNRRGEREPKMVSAEYVTMLESQQEQLIAILRKLHMQSSDSNDSSSNTGKKDLGPSIQKILESFPQAKENPRRDDELPHKKPRKSTSPETTTKAPIYQPQPMQQIPLDPSKEMFNVMDFPLGTDSDLFRSLDITLENNTLQTDYPILDPSVWDGLDIRVSNTWLESMGTMNTSTIATFPETTTLAQSQIFSEPQQEPFFSNEQVNLTGLGSSFCDPRDLERRQWDEHELSNQIWG